MGGEWRQGEEAKVRRVSYLPDESCTRTRGQARCPPRRKLRKEQNRKQSVKTNDSDSLLCREVAASGAGERVAAKHRIGAGEQREEKHPPCPRDNRTEFRAAPQWSWGRPHRGEELRFSIEWTKGNEQFQGVHLSIINQSVQLAGPY